MQTRARALTEGPIAPTLLRFALPMMVGNLLQQLYNIADTLIVGRYVGADALAAVGSAYTLMTFLTSILLGLSMGSGVAVSISFGRGDADRMRREIFLSLGMIGGTAVLLNVAVFLLIDPILWLLQVPAEVWGLMRTYLLVIFVGIGGTFLYNYYACLLRAVGDSVRPLVFLGVSAVLNIVLDVAFVLGLGAGVAGAAWATVIAQWLSGAGLCVYALATRRDLRLHRADLRWDKACAGHVFRLSFITGAQQSIMNFGILMVQGRVNSFGPAVMAAFAAAVKIDSFAYMPVQDFGNAFSTFIAQNFGAGRYDRIRRGTRTAVAVSMLFGVAVSAVVFVLARSLMLLFVQPEETEILAVGVQYLRTEGAFYCLIALLFLLYGFYRAIERPGMSVVLTVISLGLRVVLAYALSAIPALGAAGIWVSIPIGWVIADIAGCLPMAKFFRTLPQEKQSK
ncbi:MATE family efflux transporter [uncultured Subdoligranulum sp.]|uniref:MATE family efflux transporter n=1 Tax=uncultured Subdoligranulum sp. TaxID=512298 RepID=UPI002637190E|nr:MATE family efflux transporter [uncultured Subdoligranulum sp.]